MVVDVRGSQIQHRLGTLYRPTHASAFHPVFDHLPTRAGLLARRSHGETRSVGKKAAKSGRPRKPEEIRALVIQMAGDNGWGLGRILGELKKLGIRKICKSTVRNVLLENGFDPHYRAAQAGSIAS